MKLTTTMGWWGEGGGGAERISKKKKRKIKKKTQHRNVHWGQFRMLGWLSFESWLCDSPAL